MHHSPETAEGPVVVYLDLTALILRLIRLEEQLRAARRDLAERSFVPGPEVAKIKDAP